MHRHRSCVLATFMVVAFAFLFSCAHTPSPRHQAYATADGTAIGEQADVPPLPDMVTTDGHDDGDEGRQDVPSAFTVPEGWGRVPDEHLKHGDAFAIVHPDSKAVLSGTFSSSPQLPGIAIVDIAQKGGENGFDVDPPFLSEDGAYATVAMRRADVDIVIGWAIIPDPDHPSAYLFARGPSGSGAVLASAMTTVITTLMITQK